MTDPGDRLLVPDDLSGLPRVLRCAVPLREIDPACADEFERILDEVVASVPRGADEPMTVLLDLSDVELLGAAGVGRLVRFLDQLEREGTSVLVLNPHALVRRVLEVTGLGDLVVSAA